MSPAVEEHESLDKDASSLAKVRARLPRVLAAYKTLFAEIAGLFRWRLVPPLVLGAGGIALQVLAIGIVFQYVHHLIQNEAIERFGLSIQPRESLPFLAAISLACLLLLATAAYLTYLYNSRAVSMSCRLENHCIQSLSRALGQSPTLRIPKIEDAAETSALKIAMSDTRACGRSFLLAFTAVIPGLTFLAGAAFLFYLHWKVTAILSLALLAFFGAAYRVSQFGVASNKDMEKFGSRVRKSLRDRIWFFRENSVSWDHDPGRDTGEQTKDVESYLKAYDGVFGLSYRSSLLGDLFLALTLTAVLFTLSMTSILGQEHHWGAISAYLIGLQYTVRYLKQTLNAATVCNRFFPQVARFFNLRHHAELAPRAADARTSVVARTDAPSPFHPQSCKIERGKPALLVTARGIGRYDAPLLLDKLIETESAGQKSPRKYGAALVFSSSADAGTIGAYLAASSFAHQAVREIEERKGPLFDCAQMLSFERISEFRSVIRAAESKTTGLEALRRTCFTLSLLAAMTARLSWVFLNYADAKTLGEAERRSLFQHWSERFVFLVNRDLAPLHGSELPLPGDMATVVVSADRSILWTGALAACRQQEAAIAKLLQGARGSLDTAVAAEGESLDLAEI